MKKNKIIMLLLIAVSFSSCENNDADYIVGNWKVQSVINAGITYTTLGECDSNSLYIFYNDGIFEANGESISSQGEICMLSGVRKWKKVGSAYQLMSNSNYVLAEIVKTNRDTIMIQNLSGYNSDFKKILVRQ